MRAAALDARLRLEPELATNRDVVSKMSSGLQVTPSWMRHLGVNCIRFEQKFLVDNYIISFYTHIG